MNTDLLPLVRDYSLIDNTVLNKLLPGKANETIEQHNKNSLDFMDSNNFEYLETKLIGKNWKTRYGEYLYIIPPPTNFDYDNPEFNFMIKNVRTRVPLGDNIKYIKLEIGSEEVERVYPKYFNILRDIYGIEQSDVIPFYSTNKLGIPFCRYHEIRIFIRFEDEDDTQYYNDTMIIDYYRILKPSTSFELLYYDLQVDDLDDLPLLANYERKYPYFKRTMFSQPMFFLIMKDYEKYEIKLDFIDISGKYEISIYRYKIIDGMGIYKIANWLGDTQNTINFSRTEGFMVENENSPGVNILGGISSHHIMYRNGMCYPYRKNY